MGVCKNALLLLLASSKIYEIFGQLPNVCHRYRIVVAHPNSTNTPMALQAQQLSRLRPLKELLFGSLIHDSKANIHPTSHGPGRHDLIDLRVLVQYAVNHLGFCVGESFLPCKPGSAVGIEQRLHDCAGYGYAEDWHRVV